MEPGGEQKKAAAEEVPEGTQGTAPVEGNRLRRIFRRLFAAVGVLLRVPKHFLQAGTLKIIDASSALLQRLRKRAAEPGDAEAPSDERGEAREERPAKSKVAHPKEAAPKEAAQKEAAVPHPHNKIHSILLYLLALIIGTLAGMTFSFLLFSTMVANQANKIDGQRDEISQLEIQHSRLLESEAKYRKESNEYQQRLSELEALEAARIAATVLSEITASPAAAARGRQPVARKTGTCNVDAGNIDNNLTRCVEEFNRK